MRIKIPVPESTVEIIGDMRKSGHSFEEIAYRVRFGKTRVAEICREYDFDKGERSDCVHDRDKLPWPEWRKHSIDDLAKIYAKHGGRMAYRVH